ncbi:MAG: NAD-dependent epimerase/dehydratase family protein [Candidatus Krumholzibacteria bacterium]|nr:NAD-dependent epimerase/dehydratase family protein [Candidatus Krumholzibacteria bacterium]
MPDGIFITGGTGNTGQALLRLIAADEAFRGVRITGLCRPGGRGERLLPFGVKIAGGDASSAASLGKVYRGEPVVIHLSSIFHAGAVLEGCRGMKRLVAASSTRVFSKTWERAPEIEAAERAIERSGVPYTILRPTMIYGNSEDRNISKFIRLIMKYRIVPLPGGGKSIFQPVHVDDLAACILAALKTPASAGKSYNVPGGSAHSLREIVEIIAGILKKRVLIVPFPLALAEAAAGLQEKLLPRPFIHREQIERLREDKRYDYSEAARDFGYAPRSFAEGVSEEIRLIHPAETSR